MTRPRFATLAERFAADANGHNRKGCIVWRGATDASGYGVFSFNGRTRKAHRVAWELAHGAIVGGLFVCHHCDVRACVNADHLFLGTNQDNMRDALRKGRLGLPYKGRPHRKDCGCKLCRATRQTATKVGVR